ncbi:MAG: hypothetical protein CM1200mP10_01370 [Candidatus Neomarinimicrobiota bacterium]|nr:MAG: hypothetical protein CM1200mP10_01370 [Candidatus Neomarinimicrobiota bacterium]
MRYLFPLNTSGGPLLSIDFKGGTPPSSTFSDPVDVNDIRSAMSVVSIDGQHLILEKQK